MDSRSVTASARSGWVDIQIADSTFTAPEHWFWNEFDSWEASTWRFYKRFADPDRTAVDFGPWIGPTVMLAKAAGAGPIVAVEASAPTAAYLRQVCEANGFDDVTIINRAIDPRPGPISFGSQSGPMSSAASVRGDGLRVETTTIAAILGGVAEPSLVKVDIEGSEETMIDDLVAAGVPTLLSLHPPLWQKPDTRQRFVAAVEALRMETPEGDLLEADALAERMAYVGEVPPPWGMFGGNYFDVVLLPR